MEMEFLPRRKKMGERGLERFSRISNFEASLWEMILLTPFLPSSPIVMVPKMSGTRVLEAAIVCWKRGRGRNDVEVGKMKNEDQEERRRAIAAETSRRKKRDLPSSFLPSSPSKQVSHEWQSWIEARGSSSKKGSRTIGRTLLTRRSSPDRKDLSPILPVPTVPRHPHLRMIITKISSRPCLAERESLLSKGAFQCESTFSNFSWFHRALLNLSKSPVFDDSVD